MTDDYLVTGEITFGAKSERLSGPILPWDVKADPAAADLARRAADLDSRVRCAGAATDYESQREMTGLLAELAAAFAKATERPRHPGEPR